MIKEIWARAGLSYDEELEEKSRRGVFFLSEDDGGIAGIGGEYPSSSLGKLQSLIAE